MTLYVTIAGHRYWTTWALLLAIGIMFALTVIAVWAALRDIEQAELRGFAVGVDATRKAETGQTVVYRTTSDEIAKRNRDLHARLRGETDRRIAAETELRDREASIVRLTEQIEQSNRAKDPAPTRIVAGARQNRLG